MPQTVFRNDAPTPHRSFDEPGPCTEISLMRRVISNPFGPDPAQWHTDEPSKIDLTKRDALGKHRHHFPLMNSARSRRSTARPSLAPDLLIWFAAILQLASLAAAQAEGPHPSQPEGPHPLFRQHCVACHEGSKAEGNLDLLKALDANEPYRELIFENIATGKMPPADAELPSQDERHEMLAWLATRQPKSDPGSFRRISRHEFVHRVNDLLGTELDLADQIPDDRGTYPFDTDRRIPLSGEVLRSYFAVADMMLDAAFPADGFPQPQSWVTNKLKESHETYRIYVRDFREGVLLSWTRANNGNSYGFFFDGFDPPLPGWYDLTFEAAKVGDFEEHVSIEVLAGKYYYADDRPQPQRLVGVISLGDRDVQPHALRVFLHPGENVSVHCHCEHNWRQQPPTQGAYIRQLKVRGPVQSQWPPLSYEKVFGDLAQSTQGKVVIAPQSPDSLANVIRRFAQRAFATRLSDADLTPYLESAQRDLSERGDFVGAVKVGLKTVICSPRFLMTPGEHSSKAFSQVASLARTLWLSLPDAELLGLAADSASSELSEQTLRTQIHRMLADRRSDRMIESFCDQWLNLRSWNKVTPSLKLYPGYDDLLHHYLPLETEMYLSYLIRENMPVGHLIDSDYTFLNQRLARHYGIPGVTGQHLRKVTFDADIPRGGLLTMGSVLKVTTDGFYTSPILRGAWVARKIVGLPVSPPPEPVKAIEPEHGTAATTLRERIERHKNNATCFGCHKSIDPYGFALESFDAIGQWREKYRVESPHQGTFLFRPEGYFSEAGEVDPSGEVGGHRFSDIAELKELLLADHRRVGYNFAKKFFEYACGYEPNLGQRLSLLALLHDEPDKCRMKDVVTGVLIRSLAENAP